MTSEIVPRKVLDAEVVDQEEVRLPDRPALPVPVGAPLPAPWRLDSRERRPVVPVWARSAQERGQAARWATGYAWHAFLFHAIRLPLYALRVALWAPRGMLRLGGRLFGWATDVRSRPLILSARDARDAKEYRSLVRESEARVKARLIVLGAVLVVGTVGGSVAWWTVPRWVLFLVGALFVVVCARAGQNPDRPLMEHAALPGKVRKLSTGIVLRAFIAAKLAKDDDPITFTGPPARDGAGWRVILDLPFGRTAEEAMDKRGAIASGLDVDERCLFLSRVRGAVGSARRVSMWVADEDPLAIPAGPSPLIRMARVNFWQGFPFGRDERGEEVTLNLLWSSLLIGAVPRQGKSFAARLVALAAALDPHVRLLVFDLKGGADWLCFRHVAEVWQLGDVPDPETGVDPVKVLLDTMLELRAEVDHRYRTLRKLPPEIVPEGKLTEELARTKHAGMPLVLVVIDEVQRAFTHKEYGKQLEEVLEDIVKVAPGAGIMVEAATQKPDQKSTPTAFRDQFTVRFALRVTTYQASEAVLGGGALGEGLNASTLNPEAKGCGLLRGTSDVGFEGGKAVRSYLADGTDAEQICLRARKLREAAGTLAGAALGQMPEATPAGATYNPAVDLLTVFGSDEKAHSDVLCSRLAERWPDRYATWGPTQLAAAVKPAGIRPKQVWAAGLDGETANRRGFLRAEVAAAVDR